MLGVGATRGQNLNHLRFFLFLFFLVENYLYLNKSELLSRVDSLCDLGFSALGWCKHHVL